jgi:hypothetical protein
MSLIIVLAFVLGGCDVFDAVTGDITKPVDPVAATQPAVVPPAVTVAQEAVAQAEQSLATIGAAIAQAEAQAADDPGVTAEVARLRALYARVSGEVTRLRSILDASVAAWQGTTGRPAGEVITAVGKPVVDVLPFPANVWGGLVLAGLGALGTAIQTYRQKQANKVAENIVWSIEKARDIPEFDAALVKVAPILEAKQTDAAKKLVQKVTD